MRVVRATEPAHRAACLALRFAVFVDEQGVSADAERDDLDDVPSTVHLLVLSDDADPAKPGEGEVMGVGRLLEPGPRGHPHVGRVAVSGRWRRQGVGRVLMGALEGEALERFGLEGAVTVALSAQVQAIPFYEAIGYVIAGDPYLDEGIWHRDATKVVTASPPN